VKIFSFAPIIPDSARILILGSMPGIRSLQMQEYYAHPRNHFWKIMGQLIGFDPAALYSERIRYLKEHGIALWDVLHACERAGSLDQRIVPETETPNDLPGLIGRHPEIQVVAFNGGKSWQTFKRHVIPDLSNEWESATKLLILPSTSPANAGMSFAKKLEQWQKITPFFDYPARER